MRPKTVAKVVVLALAAGTMGFGGAEIGLGVRDVRGPSWLYFAAGGLSLAMGVAVFVYRFVLR